MYRILIKILTALAVGGVTGWLAGLAASRRRERRQEILLYPIAGVVGALLGSFIVFPASGPGGARPATLTVTELWISFLSAVLLVALVDLFNRYVVR